MIATMAVLSAACSGEYNPNLGGSQPRVVSVQPKGKLQRTQPIEVQLSMPVSEGKIGRPLDLTSVALVHPQLSAVATFVDAHTFRIEPLEPYHPATSYRLSVRPDILGSDQALTGNREFTFRTPAVGLEDVRGWSVEGGIELALRFSHPMKVRDIEAGVSIRSPQGTLLPFTLLTGTRNAHRYPHIHPVGPMRRFHAQLEIPKDVKLPSELMVHVDAALASSVGGSPLSKSIVRSVPVEREKPLVENIRPVQLGAKWAVAIDLASDVPVSRLVGAVRGAGPSVSMALSPDGPWILGAFSPETTASLQIGPPLLASRQAWVLELPRLSPALRILSSQPMLDLAPGARLDVEHHAVRGLSVTAWPVPPELVGLMVDRLVPAQPMPKVWAGPMVGPMLVEAEPDGTTPINVSPLLDSLPPGLVLLEVRDEQRPWLRDIRYLNRRGLDLIVKRRRGYAWTRVQDIQGAVAKASIKILGVGGQVLATERTNSFGIGELEWSQGTAALALAEVGRRYAVLPLRGPVATQGSGRPKRQAWVIPNRIVVAPGQTVDVSVVVLDGGGDPVKGPVHISLRRPRGGRGAQTTIDLASNGTGIGELEVPSSAEVGSYVLRLQDETGTQLAEVQLKVQHQRLHGPRMQVEPRAEPLAFSVSRAGQSHSEPIHGVCIYHLEETFGGLPAPQQRIDAFGPLAVEIGRGARQVIYCPEPPRGNRPWSVRLEAHARDVASGQATTLYTSAKQYAEVEMSPNPPQAGQPLDAVVRVVDAHAKPINGSVSVEILPLEPRLGRFVRPGGRLTQAAFSSEGAPEQLTLAVVDGSAKIPFVPPRGGPWLIRMGETTEKTIWVGGPPGTHRPLSLVLHRSRQGVRAALPFPGRLLLTEEAYSVGRYKASLETAVSSEHRIGHHHRTLTGLLVGTKGRWSTAVLAPSTPTASKISVALTVDERLQPGTESRVVVDTQGVTGKGLFRVIAVDVGSAPSATLLRRWTAVAPNESALDTLVSAAFDHPAVLRQSPSPTTVTDEQLPNLRPGRIALATPWLSLDKRGRGRTSLAWPSNGSGRVRFMVLVLADGHIASTTAERVIGDGLGLDIAMPKALRVGDQLAVPVMLENGSSEDKDLKLVLRGDGFVGTTTGTVSTHLEAGELKEVRVGVEAKAEGAFSISIGDIEVSHDVERIRDENLYWRGRAATAVVDTPAVLPTPEQLGARRASLVVGRKRVFRFAAALQGMMTAPPLDGEQAAATVLAGAMLPKLTQLLGAKEYYDEALRRLPAAFEDADLWVRVCAAHAAIIAGKMTALALRTLADVVVSSSDPDATAYARLLLARVGQSAQGVIHEASSRADVLALKVATDVLLGRLDGSQLPEIPIAPYSGARKGRMGPTMVNALALLALESASLEVPASSVLEAAITSAARASRWTHPVEEALALVALTMRADRLGSKAYWGYFLLDGKTERRVRSKHLSVIQLDDKLGYRPEVDVSGPGSAEVALVLAGQPDRLLSDTLEIDVQRRNASDGIISGPVIEGRPISLVVTVRNRSEQPEKVLIDIPIPAGLEVDTAPAGVVARVGGYNLVKKLDAHGTWVGHFEATARYAGLWQAPPARVRLRHGRAETFARQEELRVEAVHQ